MHIQIKKPPFKRHVSLTVGERKQAIFKTRINPRHHSNKTNEFLQVENLQNANIQQ